MNTKNPIRTTRRLILPILAWGVATSIGIATEPESAKVSFSRDIQPILSENCFLCHGRDPSSRKAKLRLDKAEFAFAERPDGELAAIVPGEPGKSALVQRIQSSDSEDIMPPPKSKKSLTAEQRQLLVQWISEGADYEEHWAFAPARRPALPEVRDAAWVSNPIDRFVLARLESAGLAPNPPAGSNTLARRLSFDLTGLPPSPQALAGFSPDPEGYSRAIDVLFASSHYGEHRARYWLDAARYGDTHGLHLDNYREIWPYRDWVIAAFNANMPFDQFTIEQLAGDLLPAATLDQRIATGFVRCNVTTSEGGAIDEEYLAIYAKDRAATTSKVWMGLSADCAACHDHKFDPISQRDFYSLTAFFRNSTQKAMDGNAKDTPPNVFVPARPERGRWDAIGKEIASVQKQMDARETEAMPDFSNWQGKREPVRKISKGLALQVLANEGRGAILNSTDAHHFPIVDRATWVDGFFGKAIQFSGGSYAELGNIGDYERDQAFSYGAWLKSPGKATGAAIARMDRDDGHRGWDLWLQNDRVAAHLIYTWPENHIKVTTKQPLKKDKWTHVFVTYDGSSKAAGLKIYFDGVVQKVQVEGDGLNDSIRTSTSLKLGRRSTGQGFKGGALHDFRLYRREVEPAEVMHIAKNQVVRELLTIEPSKRTKDQSQTLLRHYLGRADAPYSGLRSELATLEEERTAIRNRGATTLVMDEKPGEAFAHVLKRGEYDQPQERVAPGVLEAVSPMAKELPKNRLGLARWLLAPEHPLTARVTVNRLWQQIFGTGLVATAGSFGTMGEKPSHPELLDWLAVEFRESGWDVQHLIRLMVTSSTYRQNSNSSPGKNAADRDNRLLSRGPRFRLDAEAIRDQALAASGLLSPEIGGPSVKPYQPPGVWFAVGYTRSNTARFVQDKGEDLYRRSLYTFWKRTSAPPAMEVFNAPSRESCTVRRERTNTPLQALALLNDPQFIEASRHLATAAINACGEDTRGRLDHMTIRVLARRFDDAEIALIGESIRSYTAHYQAAPGAAGALLSIGDSPADASLPPVELAAWTMAASQILNFDETITKN